MIGYGVWIQYLNTEVGKPRRLYMSITSLPIHPYHHPFISLHSPHPPISSPIYIPSLAPSTNIISLYGAYSPSLQSLTLFTSYSTRQPISSPIIPPPSPCQSTSSPFISLPSSLSLSLTHLTHTKLHLL